MATQYNLDKVKNTLPMWECQSDPDLLPHRTLFLGDEFQSWFLKKLPYLRKDRGADEPLTQVVAFFDKFVVDPNERFVGHFQNLIPQGEGVYEMKMNDVRVLGWFLCRGVFVAAVGVLKRDIKGKYPAYVKKVIGMKKKLKLKTPDHIRSKVGIHELL